MAGLSTISTILGIAGSVVSAAGTIAAGQAQRRAADYEAAQYDIKAGEERAASQIEAQEIARRKQLALSRNQAVAAGSGFGADDPSVLDLAGDIASYGKFQENLARYGGESRAEGLKAQAEGLRISGKAAERGSFFSAAGTILAGASTMFERYGKRSLVAPDTGFYTGTPRNYAAPRAGGSSYYVNPVYSGYG